MNPLLPAPETLPAAWGWLHGLLMVTFPLHLLAMNAMLGTAALSLLARLKGGPLDLRLARELAKVLPVLIALTVNLGVPPLLFAQVLYGPLLYTSSVLMAVFWLGVPLSLLAAYCAAYLYAYRFAAPGRWGFVPIALALALLFGIAFVFTGNMTLMLEPGRWSAYFGNRGGTLLDLGSPMFWPRYLHNVVGALAVGGLFVAVWGRARAGREPQVGERAVRLGLKVFTRLTLAELLLGAGFLLSVPRPVRGLFLGGSPVATGLLGAGALLAILALAAGVRGRVILCAGLTVPLLYLMAFMRDVLRAGILEPVFGPEALKVAPQTGPMVLFLAILVAGLAVIVWMVRKSLQAGG